MRRVVRVRSTKASSNRELHAVIERLDRVMDAVRLIKPTTSKARAPLTRAKRALGQAMGEFAQALREEERG